MIDVFAWTTCHPTTDVSSLDWGVLLQLTCRPTTDLSSHNNSLLKADFIPNWHIPLLVNIISSDWDFPHHACRSTTDMWSLNWPVVPPLVSSLSWPVFPQLMFLPSADLSLPSWSVIPQMNKLPVVPHVTWRPTFAGGIVAQLTCSPTTNLLYFRWSIIPQLACHLTTMLSRNRPIVNLSSLNWSVVPLLTCLPISD